MPAHHEFSAEAVDTAIAAARLQKDVAGFNRSDEPALAAGGHFLVTAECISVTVEDNQVCLTLPLGIGNVCLPMPVSVPNGTAAQACLAICSTFGIPTGR